MKKFNLFLIIVAILTVSFAGYVFISGGLGNNTSSKTGTLLDKFDTETTNENGIAVPERSGPILLSDRQVLSPTGSLNPNSILYYDKSTGELYELNLTDSTEKLVSNKPLPDLIGAVWSPLKRSVINLVRIENTLKFKHLDLTSGNETDFNANIRSVAFSPDANLIAYYYLDETIKLDENGLPIEQAGKIVLSQPSGVNGKKILDTRLKNLEISWPVADKIALKINSSDMFLLTETGQFTKLFEQKIELRERWSPSGKKLLFSSLTTDENGLVKPVLWLKDIESKEETPLDLEGDASLCAWSKDDITIICALSKSPSIHEIYKINSLDKSRKLAAEPNMLIKELLMSAAEYNLLMISAVDEKLYSIKISD